MNNQYLRPPLSPYDRGIRKDRKFKLEQSENPALFSGETYCAPLLEKRGQK